jgi:hypothetical protein
VSAGLQAKRAFARLQRDQFLELAAAVEHGEMSAWEARQRAGWPRWPRWEMRAPAKPPHEEPQQSADAAQSEPTAAERERRARERLEAMIG